MKTALIGGGIGGIITALYLQQRGEEVTIFEKETRLGGRLAFTGEDGYKIDEGPTIVLLPEMIQEILQEVNVDPKKIEMVNIDPIYPLHFKDGKSFLKWTNKEKQVEEIEKHFPGEGRSYYLYMTAMRESFENGKKAFLETSFVNKRSFWTQKNMKTLLKMRAYQSVKAQTKKYFKSKQLQEAFSLQTLYIGGAPEQTPAIYSLVSFSEHEHGIWYVKGGYASLVEALTEEVKKRGIKIEYGSEVEEICFEEDRAVSLIARGENRFFDRFVLNGDFAVAEKLVRKEPAKKFTPSSGCLLIYLGLEKPIETEYVHQFFMGESLDQQMHDIFVDKKLPSDPSFYLFSPSLIDKTLAPEGKSVAYILVPVPPVSTSIYREQYIDFAEKMLIKFQERVDPDLNKKIVWKTIRTPYEAKQEGLFAGGSFGLAPTLFQSGVFRPQAKPFAYKNVYAVGASTHPGGGIPIVMQGARLLAELIENEEVASKRQAGENG